MIVFIHLTCSGPGQLICAHVDCFSRPRTDENCVEQFELDKCCSTSRVCGDAAINDLKTCNYRGETVREGQKIYPKNAKCYVCVCNKDFIDHQNPWQQPKSCRKIPCGLDGDEEKIKNFCAPVYLKGGCCPLEWECREFFFFHKIVNNL